MSVIWNFYLALINEKGKTYPDDIFSLRKKIFVLPSIPKVHIFPFPADEKLGRSLSLGQSYKHMQNIMKKKHCKRNWY